MIFKWNGLIIKVRYVATDKYTEGQIISQSRAAGSPVARGTTLTVDVAKKTTEKPPVEETPSEGTGTESTPTESAE